MASTFATFREFSDSAFELPPSEVIFGGSEAMRQIRKSLDSIAGTNVPVLLHGKSGTGKEILARYIHERSLWGKGAFVKVNCPAIPGTLFESELFGYQKGAFTGAYASKPGRVEMAHRGSLFLDEIAELDPAMQAKLLQVLQDGQFSRIGAQEERQIEVRVICATNRDLKQEIEAGNFRQDLFFRINVVNLCLPSLKERKADIPILMEYFLDRYSAKFGRAPVQTSGRMLKLFETHSWPGNIRELENLMKRFVILGPEAVYKSIEDESKHDVSVLELPSGSMPLKQLTRQAVKQLEKKVILSMLEANHWNRRVVSRSLGISYAALLYKMREAGVPPRRASRHARSNPAVPELTKEHSSGKLASAPDPIGSDAAAGDGTKVRASLVVGE
jgi:two-component system, NtrC family, response regulator AtoC